MIDDLNCHNFIVVIVSYNYISVLFLFALNASFISIIVTFLWLCKSCFESGVRNELVYEVAI